MRTALEQQHERRLAELRTDLQGRLASSEQVGACVSCMGAAPWQSRWAFFDMLAGLPGIPRAKEGPEVPAGVLAFAELLGG